MKPFASRSASYTVKKDPKKNEFGRRVKSKGRGGRDTMLGKRNCLVGSCGGAAITALDHQALCLNHFLLRCYERLEVLDPRGRKFSAEPVDVGSMRVFVEECSRKALDRKSTRLNSSHGYISYAVFCLTKKIIRSHHHF